MPELPNLHRQVPRAISNATWHKSAHTGRIPVCKAAWLSCSPEDKVVAPAWMYRSAKQMQTAGLRQLKAQLNRDKAIDFMKPVTLIAAK